MNKISVLIFSCENYSNLWETNLLLLKRNFNKRFIYEVLIITDKEHPEKIDGAKIIVANDDNNFIKRFKTGIDSCKTDSFLFMLDDYFVTNINEPKLESLLNYFESNQIDYCKLYCRNKKSLFKCKPYFTINQTIKYSVDLYPGIWSKKFAENVLRKWSSENNSIWDFEANLWRQQIMRDSKLICAISGELVFLDVIRKGKMLRHSYRYLKKKGLLIEGIEKRSIL